MTGIYTFKMLDNFVYTDVGEEREQGVKALEALFCSLLLTAILALFSSILNAYLLRQN
jgi:hypothetical protein